MLQSLNVIAGFLFISGIITVGWVVVFALFEGVMRLTSLAGKEEELRFEDEDDLGV